MPCSKDNNKYSSIHQNSLCFLFANNIFSTCQSLLITLVLKPDWRISCQLPLPLEGLIATAGALTVVSYHLLSQWRDCRRSVPRPLSRLSLVKFLEDPLSEVHHARRKSVTEVQIFCLQGSDKKSSAVLYFLSFLWILQLLTISL